MVRQWFESLSARDQIALMILGAAVGLWAFGGLLERINLSGTTIVMATHDRSIVDRMQKRVVEVSEGRVIRDALTAGYREVPSDAINQVGDES